MSRVAVVTGALGGIGRAAVKALSENGWTVVGTDLAAEGRADGMARYQRADVGRPEDVQALVSSVDAKEGRLDALVNNAALQVCLPLAETGLEEWNSVLASNLTSVYLCSRASFPLLARQGGAIVNVSSVHALATSAGIAAYAASKGGVLALTRAAAIEMAAAGIRVNAVLPGAVDTKMLRQGLARSCSGGGDDAVRALGRKHPLGRVGRPEEIAEAILFLADGERSSFVTGQALAVDGGALCRLSTE